MSIQLMNAAWQCNIPSGEKFVLVSLCDQSNDEGVCWPSVANISKRCGMASRTVQAHIKQLEITGYISRQERSGTSWLVTINANKLMTPAESAPLQNLHPAESAPTPADIAPPPRNICTPPPQNLHPNHKEPSLNPKETPKRVSKSDDLSLLLKTGLPEKLALDWLKVRKAKKAVLTETALDGIIREAELANRTLDDVIKQCVEMSWAGFKHTWCTDKPDGQPAFSEPAKQVKYGPHESVPGAFAI